VRRGSHARRAPFSIGWYGYVFSPLHGSTLPHDRRVLIIQVGKIYYVWVDVFIPYLARDSTGGFFFPKSDAAMPCVASLSSAA
jgi:hypothetical protein